MNANRNRKNEVSPAALALVLLFFLFPPLAIVGVFVLVAYTQAKKNGQVNDTDLKSELESLKRSGMAAGEKFLRRLKEEDAAEQLKVLKDAGLLDDMEYSQRKQEILAMH